MSKIKIRPILLDMGIEEKFINNGDIYSILEEKLIKIMKYYKFIHDENEMKNQEVKDFIKHLNNQEKRKFFLGKRSSNSQDLEDLLLDQFFEELDLKDYEKFLELTRGKLATASKKDLKTTIRVKDGKIFISDEELDGTKEKYVIGTLGNSTDIGVGKQVLYSAKHSITGKINKDCIMDVDMLVYDKSGKLKSGIKETYVTFEDAPFYVQEYNPEKGEFEEIHTSKAPKKGLDNENDSTIIDLYEKRMEKEELKRRLLKKYRKDTKKYRADSRGSLKNIIMAFRNKKKSYNRLKNMDYER